jgi:hypothetical protein
VTSCCGTSTASARSGEDSGTEHSSQGEKTGQRFDKAVDHLSINMKQRQIFRNYREMSKLFGALQIAGDGLPPVFRSAILVPQLSRYNCKPPRMIRSVGVHKGGVDFAELGSQPG